MEALYKLILFIGIQILSFITNSCRSNEITTKCWESIRKLLRLRSRRPIKKWQSSGTLTKILTIAIKLSRNLEKFLRLTKTFLTLKSAKYTTPMGFKARRLLHSIISKPVTQRIYSRNSLKITSLMMIPSLVAFLATGRTMVQGEPQILEVLALLDSVKVFSTMITFSLT